MTVRLRGSVTLLASDNTLVGFFIMEIWKNIKDYEGMYQVSNLGNVKSLSRKLRVHHNSMRLLRERILKCGILRQGYKAAALWENQKVKLCTIHRLVGIAFIPNPKNKPCINHKNGIKTDNRVENLEWVTYSENMIHALKHNLIKKGEEKCNTQLTNKNALIIKLLYKEGIYTQKQIGLKYNISQHTVSRIVNKKSWKHITEVN